MIIGIIVSVILIIVLFIGFFAYRRQIKKICRQLAFISEKDTNLKLSEDCFFTELNELNEKINELIEEKKQIIKDTRHKEELFKDTITNISHDIRTPLTSLDGYFQLLTQSSSEEEREKYTAVIKERISSLNDMLEELFTYTKLQNGNYELSMEKVNLKKIVFDTVFSFYEDFKEKNLEPEIDFSEEQYYILGNKEAIKRILQNIIKNAMEHGESNIALSFSKKGQKIIFKCSNDVKNVDEIDMKQVFLRFYKADSARTHTSSGLGLSIAKGLTEKMGGTIEAGLKEQIFSIKVSFDLVEEKIN